MAFVFHKPYPVVDEAFLVEIPFVRSGKPPARAHVLAAGAFQKMREAARQEGVSLIIVSAFRPRAEQEACFVEAQRRHGRWEASRWVAPPGYSEHHTGFVFDIGDEKAPEADDEPAFEETAAFRWLTSNAKKFGFEFSFPRGNPGRVSYEPWHWRWMGCPEAHGLFHPSGLKNMFLWGRALGKVVLNEI